jgi:Uri superfamily endonuclease
MLSNSGLYQLFIRLPQRQHVKVGQLGHFSFPPGYYVYTGSAKRGREARIARHMRKRRKKKLHWHIDYLLRYATVKKVIRYENGNKSECELNQRVQSMQQGKIIAPSFGAFDCNCKSHLIYFERRSEMQKFH